MNEKILCCQCKGQDDYFPLKEIDDYLCTQCTPSKHSIFIDSILGEDNRSCSFCLRNSTDIFEIQASTVCLYVCKYCLVRLRDAILLSMNR